MALRSMRLSAPIALLALAFGGCGQDPVEVVPPTFEQPGDIAFVCVEQTFEGGELSDSALRPLSECNGFTGEETVPPTGTGTLRVLVGLVTQQAAGEVGAVDFQAERVIDANETVPGFTFTRVGQFPTAIVVPPTDPSKTYVATYGSRRVEYYDTDIFRGELAGGASSGFVPLPGGPTDMVLSPDEATLYAAVPSAGLIVPVEIGAAGALVEIAMDAAVAPGAVTELPAPFPGAPTDYEFICPARQVGVPDASRVRTTTMSLGTVAQPHQLLVVDDVLLVADQALPLIYRFQIEVDGALTELAPLAPGVPIERMAVSPVVPVAAPDAGSSEVARYLYAIDATDQSVLVMDYLEGSTTFGAVLPVRVGDGDADRLRLAGSATALDIIQFGFDPADPSYCAAPTGNEGPFTLRGVFLAVGLGNGFLELVDVVDLDGPCRVQECVSGEAADAEDWVFVQRHRPRVGTSSSDEGVETRGTPRLTVDGVTQLSTADEERIDGLAPVECPAGQSPAFGQQICASADPWSLRQETWRATWEGTIPGTTALARRDGDRVILPDGAADFFCDRGVLGRTDAAASGLGNDDPEAGYTGDWVVVTSEPDESKRGIAACEPYFAPDTGAEPERLELPILEAFEGELQVFIDGPEQDILDSCYDTFFGISVRLDQAFLVTGSVTGFLHRVVADETTGACRVDTVGQPIVPSDPSTYRNGRAFAGTPGDPPLVRDYENPFVSFAFDVLSITEEAELQFALTGVAAPLAVPVGLRVNRPSVPTIVEQVVYSPTDGHLYVIESSSSSLVRYEVGEFQLDRVYE